MEDLSKYWFKNNKYGDMEMWWDVEQYPFALKDRIVRQDDMLSSFP